MSRAGSWVLADVADLTAQLAEAAAVRKRARDDPGQVLIDMAVALAHECQTNGHGRYGWGISSWTVSWAGPTRLQRTISSGAAWH